jgi:hypothetical protein
MEAMESSDDDHSDIDLQDSPPRGNTACAHPLSDVAQLKRTSTEKSAEQPAPKAKPAAPPKPRTLTPDFTPDDDCCLVDEILECDIVPNKYLCQVVVEIEYFWLAEKIDVL